MKMKIMGLLCLSLPSTLFAADSSWLLCKGPTTLYEQSVNLVVNSYEHRDGLDETGNAKRSDEITFIYGGHILSGRFNSSESDSADIVLKKSSGTGEFKGTVAVDYQTQTLKLNGKIVLFADEEAQVLKVSLPCEELN